MPGKRVYAKSVSRVRIPLSPRNLKIIECTSPRCVTVIKRFSIMYLSEI